MLAILVRITGTTTSCAFSFLVLCHIITNSTYVNIVNIYKYFYWIFYELYHQHQQVCISVTTALLMYNFLHFVFNSTFYITSSSCTCNTSATTATCSSDKSSHFYCFSTTACTTFCNLFRSLSITNVIDLFYNFYDFFSSNYDNIFNDFFYFGNLFSYFLNNNNFFRYFYFLYNFG